MEEIIQKIRELMAVIDPGLDTSSESAFDQVVLQYIRDQFGVGELELDLADMIRRRINQLDPTIATAPGSAVDEFLIKVLPAIFQVPRLEIQRIKNNQDLNNIEAMTDVEADRRVSNFLVARREGDVAIGRVRAYFTNPVPIRTNLSNRAVTASGLAFFPDGAFEASQSLLAASRENGLYYVDIPYVAEAAGDQYNISKDEITTIENMPGLVRATNTSRFVGGIPRETNAGLIERVRKSISERSLSSRPSIITIITESLPNQAQAVFPVGFGDSEMQRDAFTVGPSVDVDSVILQVETAAGTGPYALLAGVDPESVVVYDGVAPIAGANFAVSVQTGAPDANGIPVDELNLTGVPSGPVIIQYMLLDGYVPLVARLPGSVEVPPLFPAPAQEQTVHIGGKIDVYVKPTITDTGTLLVSALGRFTVFKASDGVISQDPGTGLWYLSTARALSISEIGAVRGDVLEILEQDAYSNTVAAALGTMTILKPDPANNRYLLSAGPSDSLERNNVDIRIRLQEDRAFPLERLVAVDNLGDPVYLDESGDPDNRGLEYLPGVNLPLAPTMGFLNRDSNDSRFPRTYQTRLPQIITRASSLLEARPSGVDDTSSAFIAGIRYADSSESVGKILYAAAEENIASGNIQLPWTRVTEVSFYDALSQQALGNQYVRYRYPADCRSFNIGGAVDSDATNTGKECAGRLRLYFENPLAVMIYGQGYGEDATRFVHRVEREVTPGVVVTFNLVYRALTHGPAGGPAVLMLPSDFVYDNGLWYIEIVVQGSTVESTRSDGLDAVETDLNLDEGQEMWSGLFGLDEEVYHRADEIEYETAGLPDAVEMGTSTPQTPVDAEHPYLDITAAWSGSVFTLSMPASENPGLVTNQVTRGMSVLVLDQAPTAFKTGAVSGLSATVAGPEPTHLVVDPLTPVDFEAAGVQVGDLVEFLAGTFEVLEFETTNTTNDTLVLSGSATVGTSTFDVFKWVIVRDYTVTDVLSESELSLNETSTGSGIRFVIVRQSGLFRIKNPHNTLSNNTQLTGSPGNSANQAIRTEGYWFDCRNPFDRTLEDANYTFSVHELTLFRYTEGADTRYLPQKDPLGDEITLRSEGSRALGKFAGNLTLLSGKHTAVVSSGARLTVGPGKPIRTEISAVNTDLENDSVDISKIRVFIAEGAGYKELLRIASGSPAVGEFVFEHGTGASFPYQSAPRDRVVVHATDAAAGGYVLYLPRVDSVTVVEATPPAHLSGAVTELQDGALIVFVEEAVTATELCDIINDSREYLYAQPGKDDAGADVVFSTVIAGATASITLGSAAQTVTHVAADFVGAGVVAGDLVLIEDGTYPGIYPVTASVPGDPDSVVVSNPLAGTVTESVTYSILRPYANTVNSGNGLGDNFLSRKLTGRSIQIDYEWSDAVAAVDEFVVSPATRSSNQDIMARHGIPVIVHIDVTVNSAIESVSAVRTAIRDYTTLLDQQSLKTSAVIRLPVVAQHIPVPIKIIGVTTLENRRQRTYRDDDGIDPRRIEVLLPGEIEVVVNQ